MLLFFQLSRLFTYRLIFVSINFRIYQLSSINFRSIFFHSIIFSRPILDNQPVLNTKNHPSDNSFDHHPLIDRSNQDFSSVRLSNSDTAYVVIPSPIFDMNCGSQTEDNQVDIQLNADENLTALKMNLHERKSDKELPSDNTVIIEDFVCI